MTIEEALRDKPLSPDVQERLVEQFDPLCWNLARRRFRSPAGRRYGELADLHAEAVLLLLRAGQEYDPDRLSPLTGEPVRFITFAYKCVWNGLLNVTHRAVLIPTPKNAEAIDVQPLPDASTWEPAAPEPEGMASDERQVIRHAVNRLSERGRLVVSLRFGLSEAEPRQQKEVARLLGVTPETVRRDERSAMEFLRAVLT